jgi:hypothetical protein
MPQYLVIRKRGKHSVIVGLTPTLRSIRRAWGFFKKNHKRKIINKWEYHFFPINHARFWQQNKEGKWRINSWYGNHNREEFSEKMRRHYLEVHKDHKKVNH